MCQIKNEQYLYDFSRSFLPRLRAFLPKKNRKYVMLLSMDRLSDKAAALISTIPDHEVFGRVTKVLGLLVEIAGFGDDLTIGSMVHLRPEIGGRDIPCEVVGFREQRALLLDIRMFTIYKGLTSMLLYDMLFQTWERNVLLWEGIRYQRHIRSIR